MKYITCGLLVVVTAPIWGIVLLGVTVAMILHEIGYGLFGPEEEKK